MQLCAPQGLQHIVVLEGSGQLASALGIDVAAREAAFRGGVGEANIARSEVGNLGTFDPLDART